MVVIHPLLCPPCHGPLTGNDATARNTTQIFDWHIKPSGTPCSRAGASGARWQGFHSVYCPAVLPFSCCCGAVGACHVRFHSVRLADVGVFFGSVNARSSLYLLIYYKLSRVCCSRFPWKGEHVVAESAKEKLIRETRPHLRPYPLSVHGFSVFVVVVVVVVFAVQLSLFIMTRPSVL